MRSEVGTQIRASSSDLEGGAHAGAAETAETPEIAGIECQRASPPSGNVPKPCAELRPPHEADESRQQLPILMVNEEIAAECLASEVARSFAARDAIMTLRYLFSVPGAPEHLRSDNRPEFVAKDIQEWLARASVCAMCIQKGSPWENRYVQSLSGRLRGERLNRALFLSLRGARVDLDQWRMDYRHWRPYGGLRWLTPAAFVAGLVDQASGAFPAASRGVSRITFWRPF